MDVVSEVKPFRSNPGLPRPLRKAAWKTTWAILLVAAGYFIAARLSLLLAVSHTNATPVWPPTGIALAVTLLFGYRVAPGIFLGALAANVVALIEVGLPTPGAAFSSLLAASGNTLEALVGSVLIRRFGNAYPFDNVRDVFVFVLFGAVTSTTISATVGVSGFCLNQGDWSGFMRLWMTWWLGDAAGAIVVAPLCLTLAKTRPGARRLARTDGAPSSWSLRRIGEAALLCALLFVVSVIVFSGDNTLKYLTLPILLWVVLRFGLFEVSCFVALLSALAVFGTIRNAGGLDPAGLADALLLMQSYICVVALTALFFSAVMRGKRQTEDALRSEKAFADTVIDSVPGAFYVLDKAGRFVRWNRILEEINDPKSESLLGEHSLRNIIDEDQEVLGLKIAEAFEKGQSEAEGRIRTKTGLRHYLFTGRRVDIEGSPYVVGSGIDITERKLAELERADHQRRLEEIIESRTAELSKVNAELQAEIRECMAIEATLAESEKKYRDLVEGANSVIIRWTKDGPITFANRYACEFFGYREEELLGQSLVGSIAPHVESSGRDLSRLMKDIFERPGDFAHNENENIRKNGERVWVSWTNKPVYDGEGRIVEMLSVGNDITSRRIAQIRLKSTLDELEAAKKRAEEADRLKSAFLATMSHELRTPLNSIIGFTSIVLKGYVGDLNDEQHKQLNMVLNSANHLLSLINDVLDISKIEAGQLQVSLAPMHLAAAIDQSVRSVRPSAEKKNLLLSMDISPGIGTIVSDQRRVEQVLLNLLSNAIKFTEQGEVRVKCTKEQDGSVMVSVEDTGIGIREEDMGRLFNAFQQVDSGTTRRFEGTGLGLYVCKKLMELLGGSIWVTSRWNVGSIFSFRLPGEEESAIREEQT